MAPGATARSTEITRSAKGPGPAIWGPLPVAELGPAGRPAGGVRPDQAADRAGMGLVRWQKMPSSVFSIWITSSEAIE